MVPSVQNDRQSRRGFQSAAACDGQVHGPNTRILFVNDYFNLAHSEGARAHIEGLCEGLSAYGYEVWSLPGSNNPYSHKLSSNPLLRLRQVAGMDAFYVRVCWRLPRYRYIREPFHTLLGRKPIVWEVNSTVEYSARGRDENVVQQIPPEEEFRRQQAKRIALAICNTEGLAKYADWLGVRKTVVIPLGVNPERFHPDVEPIEGVPRQASQLNVLWCGATEYWWHDLDTALAAAEILKDSDAFHFYVVGDVPAEAPHLPNVTYLGRLPYDQMPHCLASMDIGLMLYREGAEPYCMGVCSPRDTGSPIKLFEYLASGLVAVATPLRQVQDRIIREGENGFLIGFEDADGLVRVLRRIQTQPDEMPAVRQAAVNTVRDYFNWDRVASETAGALRQVTGLGIR